MAAPSFAEDLISVRSRKRPTLNELFENLPKQLTKDVLQQLHRAVFECDPEQIPQHEDGVSSLLAVILHEGTGVHERHLALVILKSLCPQYGLEEMLLPLPTEQLVLFLSALLVQGTDNRHYPAILDKLIRGVEDSELGYEYKACILLYLTDVAEDPSCPLSEDDCRKVLRQFPSWLLDCSAFSAKKPSSSATAALGLPPGTESRFRRSETPQPICEMDGTVSRKMFTVLSCSKYNTADQTMNVAAFSVLRPWMKIALRLRYAEERLVSTVRQYCLYVLEQSQKKPTQPEDCHAQRSCLVEALRILDLLCRLDGSAVHEIAPTVRRLADASYHSRDVAVDTAVLQFLLHHGDTILYKTDEAVAKFFEEVVAKSYQDPTSALEATAFVRENLARLCFGCGSVLEKYFPALLKIFAWHPRHLVPAFAEILPAFMSAKTSVEVFYCLVDLPAVVAAMLLEAGDPSVPEAVHTKMAPFARDAILKFVLRNVSGIGDTFAGAATFHDIVADLSDHPRVAGCSARVPDLLPPFFATFLRHGDSALASRLLPALLERLSVCYGSPGYADRLRRTLADALPPLFRKFPETTSSLTPELVDYLSHTANRNVAPEFFTNLAWAVGEFASSSGGAKVVADYFEVLECVAFELLGSTSTLRQLQSSRLLCVLLTSLAKLAARCQDLMPRALLCLSKTAQACGSDPTPASRLRSIVIGRVRELSAVLQTSGVASTILTPGAEEELEMCHRDVAELPALLEVLADILPASEAT